MKRGKFTGSSYPPAPQRGARRSSAVDAPTERWPSLPAEARKHLDDVLARSAEHSKTLVGYPCNQRFDFSELFPFLQFALNNIGDPFADSNYRLNTHDIEREVLATFARYTQASLEETWGYVTCGGTEGNLYGLYLARELYSNGIVYYSEDTHYSVSKSLKLLGTRNIMIRSQDNGELDYDDLKETLRLHRDVTPIVFANIGTTMKGAIDDIARIRSIISDLRLRDSYVHCDAALSGMILPFVDESGPWNFAHGADSISISGHKLIGAPLPCGVVLAKRRYVDRIARAVEYVGVLDTTIGGSRNGFTPMVLYYALMSLGDEGFRKLVGGCLDVAKYALEQLQNRGIPAWRNTNSITIVFPRPTDDLVRKWQLAPYRDIAHLLAMPHVTREVVDDFVADYIRAPIPETIRHAASSAGSSTPTEEIVHETDHRTSR